MYIFVLIANLLVVCGWVFYLPWQSPSHVRSVLQFQFKAWPDHGVPAQPGVVLSFLHDVNNKQKSMDGAGPMVVHCRSVTDVLCAEVCSNVAKDIYESLPLGLSTGLGQMTIL